MKAHLANPIAWLAMSQPFGLAVTLVRLLKARRFFFTAEAVSNSSGGLFAALAAGCRSDRIAQITTMRESCAVSGPVVNGKVAKIGALLKRQLFVGVLLVAIWRAAFI